MAAPLVKGLRAVRPTTEAMPRRTPPPRPFTAAEPSSDGPAGAAVWLTRASLVLAGGLIFSRATMLETLRNPLDVQPGADPVPLGPGAAAGLVLDLLCCVPAMLVLARRAFDPAYALRFAGSFLPLALLAVWTLASTLWAGDRFAAFVGGMH